MPARLANCLPGRPARWWPSRPAAGSSPETVMAAHGSGAVARSTRDKATVMNIDVGGGTSKIAICCDGRVSDLTAVDVGARLVCLDSHGQVVRLEEAGRRFGAELGLDLEIGRQLAPEGGRRLAALLADKLFEAALGGSPSLSLSGGGLLRLDP